MSWFPRVLGAATAAHGAAVVARPEVLTTPTGLDDSLAASSLTRAVGARDLASGPAVAFAPAGAPLRLAPLVRVAMDLGDAALGLAAPDRAIRAKVVGAAALGGPARLATGGRASDEGHREWNPQWSDPSYWADPSRWERERDQAV